MTKPCQKPWIYERLQLEKSKACWKFGQFYQKKTIRESGVERKDLRPCCKSGKKPVSWSVQQNSYLQISRNFTNSRKKTNRRIYRSLTFLNIWTTFETFQQSGKRDCLKQLLKGSASINERSGSLFLRINLRIQ